MKHETWKQRGFTVINVVKCAGVCKSNAKNNIEKAYAASTKIKLLDFDKMFYGKLYLVESHKNWMAWYTSSNDSISLAPTGNDEGGAGGKNLLHELAHRWYLKKATTKQKKEWVAKGLSEEDFCEVVVQKAFGKQNGAIDSYDSVWEKSSNQESIGRVAKRYLKKETEKNLEKNLIQRVAAKYQEKKQVDKADGSGKTTVYVYSEGQVAHRHREKAKRLEKLRTNIASLRSKVKEDLQSKDAKKKLTALAVAMIDSTCERPGNEESVKERNHYGITTMEVRHLSFKGNTAQLKYTGKSGVEHLKTIKDKTVIKHLKDAVKGKGKEERILCEGDDCKVSASDVNSYLKEHDITAKDIRGLHANEEMKKQLKEIRKKGPKLSNDKKEKEKQLKEEFKKALETTAKYVGHEAATLKGQYLVPGLEEDYLKDGTVTEKMTNKKSDLSPPLGYPGGVCHVVQRIHDEVRSPRLKEQLSDKMEGGDKLTNPEANKVYNMTVENGANNKLIRRLAITPHAQFRMDQRGITVQDVRAALMHFSKEFYDSKSKNGYHYKEWQKQMAWGDAIKYIAQKIGRLVIVFNVTQQTAILVTTYWQSYPDPKPTDPCTIR